MRTVIISLAAIAAIPVLERRDFLSEAALMIILLSISKERKIVVVGLNSLCRFPPLTALAC